MKTKIRFVVRFMTKEGRKYNNYYDTLEEAMQFAIGFKDNDTYSSIKIHMIEERELDILTIRETSDHEQ